MVLATSARACIYHNYQLTLSPEPNFDADVPSALFPQAQVLVGNLFSVTALSQAILCVSTVAGKREGTRVRGKRRTALKRRLLSARASSFFGADAFAVVAVAAGHDD
jgi:hypothetical protein